MVVESSAAVCQPVHSSVPVEITGEWTIGDVIGTQPMLLEVPSMAALLGRKVVIGDALQLWDLYSGRITSVERRPLPLRGLVAVPTGATSREIAEAGHQFDMFEIGTDECRTHGVKLDACPVFVIGHDLETDQIGLVTFPFGFAAFEPKAAGSEGAPRR